MVCRPAPLVGVKARAIRSLSCLTLCMVPTVWDEGRFGTHGLHLWGANERSNDRGWGLTLLDSTCWRRL
jgi:hypothetical protein